MTGTAGNGGEAINKAQVLKPDVILMDIEMPNFGGLDAIGPIKEKMTGGSILCKSLTDRELEKMCRSCYRTDTDGPADITIHISNEKL